MKPVTATLTIILFIFSASAQNHPVKNSLQTDIAKVISDYPNGFKNISGDQLIENPQTISSKSIGNKKCNKVPCDQIQFKHKQIFSWQRDDKDRVPIIDKEPLP